MIKRVLSITAGLALVLGAGLARAGSYVGSDHCFKCHQDQYNYWQASGHPWKLRKMRKARYAKLPLPKGWSWRDISYVIGGANKKARYIDKQGYIITTAKDGSEAKTQYNMEDGSWSYYHKGQKKPYKCGPCHMTAYRKEGHQDGLPGMIGTWEEDGIGCEECHGPGSRHIKNPKKARMKIDRSARACGKCHQRGGINPTPPAKGGFIRHHEQMNELLAGPHSDLTCVDCHEPHQRAILVRKGICAECHEEVSNSYAANIHARDGIACLECHMPRAAKSAIKTGKHSGDVRTHIFRINSDPGANMFAARVVKGKKKMYAKGFVTLDFACLGCHAGRDVNWAAANAKKIH